MDFARDDDDWVATWGEDSEGEASWLEGLRADMDFAGFLPEGEVAEGDRWELDLAVTQELFSPGGKVFVSEPREQGDLPEGGVAILIPDSSGVRRYDELEGSLEAVYMGQRDEDGRRVGVIAIELELEGALGVAEDLSRIIMEDNGQEQMFDEAELHRSLSGKGEILWDLEGKHLASMSFEAEFESDLESAWEVSAGDMALSCQYHSARGGQIKTSMSVERVTE